MSVMILANIDLSSGLPQFLKTYQNESFAYFWSAPIR